MRRTGWETRLWSIERREKSRVGSKSKSKITSKRKNEGWGGCCRCRAPASRSLSYFEFTIAAVGSMRSQSNLAEAPAAPPTVKATRTPRSQGGK